MTNEIKIFNSEKEAKGLEGTLIDEIIVFDGNDIADCFFYFLNGKFTAMQRVKDLAKRRIKGLGDYGVIVDKFENYINHSKSFAIKVNYYKNKK